MPCRSVSFRRSYPRYDNRVAYVYPRNVYDYDRYYSTSLGASVYVPYSVPIYGGGGYSTYPTFVENPPVVERNETTAPVPSVDSLIEVGLNTFAAGEFDDARRLFIQAILMHESDGFATFLYALTCFAEGEFELAGSALRRALAGAPELIESPIDVAQLFSNPETVDAQMTALQSAMQQRPGQEDFHLLSGYLLFATGRPQEAQALFEVLIRSNGQDELAILLRDATIRVMQPQPSTPVP